MQKDKKYSYHLVENESGWTAEIIRKVSSKQSIVTKSQDGFDSEIDAQDWAKAELKLFLKGQTERNQRKKAAKQKQID